MNKINIITKLALTDEDWCRKTLRVDKLFDTKEEALKYKHDNYLMSEVSEVAVLEGDVTPGKCKAYPVPVTIIKYKDLDGKLWDKEEHCEAANACHVINEVIGEKVFEYKEDWDHNWPHFHKKSGVFEFTITKQEQIDALWVIYKDNYKFRLEKRILLNYDNRSGRGYCDEIEKQKDRPKWINKLNNIQKLFDKSKSVICKIKNHPYTDYYRGEEYDAFEEFLLVKLGKTGVTYIRKDLKDKTCKTCKFRGTDCGYTCKGNSEPRCYVEVEEEDVKARPKAYKDAFEVRDTYDWNELDKYDFDVNAAIASMKKGK